MHPEPSFWLPIHNRQVRLPKMNSWNTKFAPATFRVPAFAGKRPLSPGFTDCRLHHTLDGNPEPRKSTGQLFSKTRILHPRHSGVIFPVSKGISSRNVLPGPPTEAHPSPDSEHKNPDHTGEEQQMMPAKRGNYGSRRGKAIASTSSWISRFSQILSPSARVFRTRFSRSLKRSERNTRGVL